jgi:hypothetical protein
MSNKKIALLVASKPAVANSIVDALALSDYVKVKNYEGRSIHNPIHEFEYKLNGQVYIFRVTSVLGYFKS